MRVIFGFKVNIGFAVSEIKKFVKEDGVDLIVMGTKGAEALEDKLFGTNTVNVIEGVECPVLSIPVGVMYTPIKNIVFATNIDEEEVESIKYTVKLSAQLKAHLYFLNIQKEEPENVKTVIQYALSNLIHKYEYKEMSFHMLEKKDIIEGIKYFSNQKKAELIVLSTHHRNLFKKTFSKSITRNLVSKLKIPVLAMHLQNEKAIEHNVRPINSF
jgi:nucleotide-binding universal stress UspA family protein